jgi:hypothetical protein
MVNIIQLLWSRHVLHSEKTERGHTRVPIRGARVLFIIICPVVTTRAARELGATHQQQGYLGSYVRLIFRGFT